MAKDADQNTLDESLKGHQSSNLQTIATDVDFKPYLDAVNTASQRTRSVIYVLIAALLLMFTALRNTVYPDWIDARLSQLQLASACYRDNILTTHDCKDALDYAKGYLFQGARQKSRELLEKREFEIELEEQIDDFIRQRTDADFIRLPFFGIAMDSNDLGTVGGLLLASILYILYASLSRELDNLERAKNKAATITDQNKRENNRELLFMSQVFASPSKSRLHVGRGIYVLFFLLPSVHFFVVFSDTLTFKAGYTLEGLALALTETLVEWISFFLVAIGCYLCYRQQKKFNQSLGNLLDS